MDISTLKNLIETTKLDRWIKWVVVLLVARVERPFLWSSFLGLNPFIRSVLMSGAVKRHISKLLEDKNANVDMSISSYGDTVTRRLEKVSNAISACLLYAAAAGNKTVAADYVSIYLWINYYGELDTPAASKILVSPRTSKFFKVKKYPSLVSLYYNKEYVIYPLIFGQILSNYLTPTRYKFNQRYLSSFIKARVLNPIWINYSLGVGQHSINWLRLFQSYFLHNLALGGVFGVMAFKSRFLDKYYELKYRPSTPNNPDTSNGEPSGKDILFVVKQYLLYSFHKANSIANFIYFPNLVSMFLLSLTSPLLTSSSFTRRGYKLMFKNYIKAIGFVSAFSALYLNSQEFFPAFGYKLEEQDDDQSPRLITKSLLNASNLYLIRLILLSKWRITKEHHPSFSRIKIVTWSRLETALMCLGVYKFMTLNDFLKRSSYRNDELESSGLLKAAKLIMDH